MNTFQQRGRSFAQRCRQFNESFCCGSYVQHREKRSPEVHAAPNTCTFFPVFLHFPVEAVNIHGIGSREDPAQVPESRIFPAPYAMDVDRFHREVEEYRKEGACIRERHALQGTVFLYVGRMIRSKGLIELATALRKAPASLLKKCSFLFVGGTLPPEVSEQLRSANVCFASEAFLKPKDLLKCYGAADFFIFPTLDDEWGFVLTKRRLPGFPFCRPFMRGRARTW